MRILVTGSDGQIGHELLKTLAPLGQVIGVCRAEGDLSDEAAVHSLLAKYDPDVVVNSAAYTSVDQAETNVDAAFTLNAHTPELLAKWAQMNRRVLIHYSTDYVYPGHGVSPQTEEEPTVPTSVYGKSKLAGDQAVLKANASALIFRTSWVYGARGRNFMLTMLRLASERPKLTVVADQYGAPTPAWLIAQVTAIALKEKLAGNSKLRGVCHLTCRGDVSWYGFAQDIIRRAREAGMSLAMDDSQVFPIATKDYPAPAPRPSNSRLDVAHIEKLLNIELPEWQAALEVTLADMTGAV